MTTTPAIMTLLTDALPVNTVADVVAAAVLEAEALAVEVVVTTAVLEAVELATDEEDAVAVGVVKVEMIPFPLTGYHQHILSREIPVKGHWCKKVERAW
jgi:hypothetical protein